MEEIGIRLMKTRKANVDGVGELGQKAGIDGDGGGKGPADNKVGAEFFYDGKEGEEGEGVENGAHGKRRPGGTGTDQFM